MNKLQLRTSRTELRLEHSRNCIDKPKLIMARPKCFIFEKDCIDKHRHTLYKHRNLLPSEISTYEKIWYKNGKYHNILGPAYVSLCSDSVEYFLNDFLRTKEEWEKEVGRLNE